MAIITPLQLPAAPARGVCTKYVQHVKYHVSHMTYSVKYVQQEGFYGVHLHHTHTQQECFADLLRDNGSGGEDGFTPLSINSPSVSMAESSRRRRKGWTDGKELEEESEELEGR